ncbi:MAG: hypothetical protein JNM00_06595, partial [Flavobacteriales bacterium]|nr:hypothetical protein [Flavobacteriales bacterium]
VVVAEGFGNNPDNICAIIALPNGTYTVYQTVTAHLGAAPCSASIAQTLVVNNPVCAVFPSFFLSEDTMGQWVIAPTTETANGTQIDTQEITITDQFDVPVFQYGWASFDWLSPVPVPDLPVGNYTITMSASGILGAPGCYATYSLPYEVATSCPGDLDGNLTVNTADLLLLMSSFGGVCGQ